MAHYMPWYQAPPVNQRYGWHWTMGHFTPANVVSSQIGLGKTEAASHYFPMIGLYDSSDASVLEYHVLLMKLAGIDGVIIDWYGKDNYLDYAMVHHNTQCLIDYCRRAGLRFAVMYEDQTLPKLIAGGVVKQSDAVNHGHELLSWLEQGWFTSPNYLTLYNRPVFTVFGPQYYKDDDWKAIFAGLKTAPLFFSLQKPCAMAVGAFAWPGPAAGTAGSGQELDAFYGRAKEWRLSIPVAYPRFHDIYAEAGVHASYGQIEDLNGKTYNETLIKALSRRQPVIQLATWNDWGEGTQIEPSIEFGYRDLETTQALRRKYVDPAFACSAADLRLPLKLFKLRQQSRGNAAAMFKLDKIAQLIYYGRIAEAKKSLE